ncbi:protein mono-ADP-ribosyltransferase PARP15-like [Watersipora subatra]|uniref:protein mono-ADP-ribosyltransferase PARP15-like n=1 Tax=Watersipora subatra TaxID=2589382 RepID=UPI00355BC567
MNTMEWLNYMFKQLRVTSWQPDSSTLPPAAENEIIIKDVTIRLETGDITEAKADVLVNSTGRNLDLSKGSLSMALMKKARGNLQEECRKLAPVNIGDVVETQGYELSCQKVYHCICPQSYSFEKVNKIIRRCMKMASKSGFTSMVIPSLGSGNLRYPPEDIVMSIITSIGSFLSGSNQTSVREVTLMVHEKDTTSVKAFTEFFQQNYTTSKALSFRSQGDVWRAEPEMYIDEPQTAQKTATMPQSHAENEIIIKDVTIRLETRDITEAKADVLVNSTGRSLDLSKGNLSMAFLKKARGNLQEECWKLAPANNGDVVETQGYELSCQKVYHCICPQSFSSERVNKIIKRCMKMASNSGFKSMVIPSLGAGQLRYPPESVVMSIVTSIDSFLSETNQTSVREVTLMVHEKDTASVKAFTKFFQHNHTTSISEMNCLREEPEEMYIEKPQPGVLSQSYVYPSHWSSPNTGYQTVEVPSNTEEWKEVEGDFLSSMEKRVDVIKITRVQNPLTYKQYVTLKDHIRQQLGDTSESVERKLWHGTSRDNIDKITSKFFDRSFAGDHGAMYGFGCYFSTTSQYSHKYSSRNSRSGSTLCMIRARVLTGEYCSGACDYKSPPYKPSSIIEQYDSVVDEVSNPTIFVIFQDASAYPEYVISYKVIPQRVRLYS